MNIVDIFINVAQGKLLLEYKNERYTNVLISKYTITLVNDNYNVDITTDDYDQVYVIDPQDTSKRLTLEEASYN